MAKQYYTAKSKIYHCIYIGSETVEIKMCFVIFLLLVSEFIKGVWICFSYTQERIRTGDLSKSVYVEFETGRNLPPVLKIVTHTCCIEIAFILMLLTPHMTSVSIFSTVQ